MRKIKLFKPYVSKKAVRNVVRVLSGTQLAEGPRVKEFEEKFASKFGFRNVSALNSGTSALELAYELAGICEGDEVITPVLTCTATNLPLVRRKAKIIFADTDYDLNIDVEDVKKKITPKTKVIVFVHFGGNNRGLKELLKIAKERKITLIEDAAQAVGSDFWGKADFSCVSLQAIKTLTCGDGGFLITKNDDLHQKGKRLRWFGYDREMKQKFGDTDLVEAGFKYQMNDISAAIGLGNLATIDKVISHRKRLMKEYIKFGAILGIWFCSILVENRERLMDYLKERGIETGIHHYRNDKYTVFGGRQELKKMNEIEEKYLLLPLHHDVRISDIKEIFHLIKGYEISKSKN